MLLASGCHGDTPSLLFVKHSIYHSNGVSIPIYYISNCVFIYSAEDTFIQIPLVLHEGKALSVYLFLSFFFVSFCYVCVCLLESKGEIKSIYAVYLLYTRFCLIEK